MTPTTPMALDEVLAVMDEATPGWEDGCEPSHRDDMRNARATIAALQSAHAEEVAGLREELADLNAAVDSWKRRAEQAEARLARVEADAARYQTLKARLIGADFAWGEETPALVFEYPLPVSADLDRMVDALAAAVAPVGVGE